MLVQLIYRSRSLRHFSSEELRELGRELSANNHSLMVSGCLLYDGTYFLQVLEGTEASVDKIYANICKDPRHTDIVLLLRDPIPCSHFDGFRMDTIDVRGRQEFSELAPAYKWALPIGSGCNRDRRAERIINAFVLGRWRDPAPAVAMSLDDENAGGYRTAAHLIKVDSAILSPRRKRFAIQPIVHPLSRRVTSVEALLRGQRGESPHEVLSLVGTDQVHQFDLQSKADAIALAAALRLECSLSINLLPMSMVSNPNAVDYLIDECKKNNWPLDRLLVEITEEEAISHFDNFLVAVQQLRASGIQVAIDDFGAGHAGLSLLADFQPDKLKLDRRIVQGVSSSGPRQAIVRSVVEFCFCLGITVVAEGVETVEDWVWLQSAGISRFQGYLFAKPLLEGLPVIHWPNAKPDGRKNGESIGVDLQMA